MITKKRRLHGAMNLVIQFHVEITNLADDVCEEDGTNRLLEGGLDLAKVARSLNLNAIDTE